MAEYVRRFLIYCTLVIAPKIIGPFIVDSPRSAPRRLAAARR